MSVVPRSRDTGPGRANPSGKPYPRSAFFPLSAALIAVLLALALAGCAKRPAPAPAYPYRSDARKVFYATSSGLSEATYEGEAEAELPASRAPNASVLSGDGKSIAIALNGWGIERVEESTDGRAYRLVDAPDSAAFAGLSTGGIWPMGGGFLVQLYRDPFADLGGSAAPAGGGAAASPSRLLFLGADGATQARPDPFPRDSEAGFEPFVLLPAKGTWFAQLRKDAAERVDMKYFAMDDPLAAAPSIREIGRADFEAALAPLPLSGSGGEPDGSLRSALEALGKGPWLARLRSGAGDDRWYLSSGKPEEATHAYCWRIAGKAGGSATVLALAPDGRLALCDARGARGLTALPAPTEGATFTALAATEGIAAASWESGEFPDISSAGILMFPIP